MIEAPKFVPARQDCMIPQPFIPNYYPELPYYLRKDVLKRIRFEEGIVSESLWNKRGTYIEKRVKGIISKLPAVKNVIRYENNSEEDILGHDLTAVLQNNTIVHMQVKSSRYGLIEFKRAIRDKYFPNNPNSVELVKQWMTKNRIILINGSETKSDEEILDDSFYPQLERIQQGAILEGGPQVQILPYLEPSAPTT